MGLVQLLRRSTKRSRPVQTGRRSHLSSPRLPSDLVLHILQLAVEHLTHHRRLRTLATLALVFAASRTWAQQALVEQAQVNALRGIKQLHGTLLARPDLAWSVKSLEVRTKGGRAEVEAISRLLLACPVLEELRMEGPAEIPSALLTVASLNTPTLQRLSLTDIAVQFTPQPSKAFKRFSRLGSAPSMPFELLSLRQLSLRRAPGPLNLGRPNLGDLGELEHPENVFPALTDLSLDNIDHHPASSAYSSADFLLHLAPQLRTVSIHNIKSVPHRFLSSCASLQLLSIPLQSLNALLGPHLPSRPRILRLTDDPSTPCSNEMYSENLAILLRALQSSHSALFSLKMLVVPDAKERDFWGERVLAEVRYEASVREVRVLEEGLLGERASDEQFWELCDELERLKRREAGEEASRGVAL